ncbi:hypothetical protein FQA39_LY12608 [Lamprigera yunnana]|nr:hypothetical protein FQA39_LY12608 [Lamprigera yunnana]
MEIIKLLRSNTEINDKPLLFEKVKSILDSGGDVNVTDNIGFTPLHLAVLIQFPELVLELLEHEADVNMQDHLINMTSLHQAVKCKDLELVCMLVCYGADVTIVDSDDMTPLMIAISINQIEIAYELLNYYDNFSQVDVNGCSAMLFATNNNFDLSMELLRRGADFQCFPEEDYNTFMFSLLYERTDLFKLMWTRDHNQLLNDEKSFILSFIQNCRFHKKEWLECFYLILSEPEFISHFVYSNYLYHRTSIIYCLYKRFVEFQIDLNERLKIVSLLLSYGVLPDMYDLTFVYSLFRYTEEVDLLLYTGGDFCINVDHLYHIDLMTLYLLGKEPLDAQARDNCTELFLQNQLLMYQNASLPECDITNILHYVHIKKEILRNYTLLEECKLKYLIPPLMMASNFPSLQELCRQIIRNSIQVKSNCPYQFIDKIRSLRIPHLLTNVILFKTPIYSMKI